MKMMEWGNEASLLLVEEYQKHPVLWDPKHNYYYSKSKKQEAWEIIAQNLNVEMIDAKHKMNSLLASFRREKGKIRFGPDRGFHYVSKWFAFEKMQFLLDRDDSSQSSNLTCENNYVEEEGIPEDGSTSALLDDPTHDTLILESNQDDKSLINLVPPQQKQEFFQNAQTSPLKRPKKKQKTNDGTYMILKNSSVSAPALALDECSVYGQHVANKLRRYNMRTRAHVEHEINNILFEADMGRYDQLSYGSNPISPSFHNEPSTSTSGYNVPNTHIPPSTPGSFHSSRNPTPSSPSDVSEVDLKLYSK